MSIEAVALQDPELRELVKNQLQLAVEKESLTVASMKREAERILNDGRETGDFTYIGNVGEIAVHSMIEKLELFSRRNPGAPIKISLNSGGGSVIDGFALVDYLLMLRRRGHKITITVFGFAASMAGVILMAADERVMTPRRTTFDSPRSSRSGVWSCSAPARSSLRLASSPCGSARTCGSTPARLSS
jgi:ATP-dependent protease ClpP protease subunit